MEAGRGRDDPRYLPVPRWRLCADSRIKLRVFIVRRRAMLSTIVYSHYVFIEGGQVEYYRAFPGVLIL